MPNINHQPIPQCPVTPPATAAPATPVPTQGAQQAPAMEPAPPASTLQPVAKKGTAKLSLNLLDNSDKAIADWKSAGKTGHRIDLKPATNTSRLAYINALIQHVDSTPGFSRDDKVRLQTFFKDIQTKAEKFDNPLHRTQILHIFGDVLATRGITDEQLKMITDGKFTAEDYVAMVNNPSPIIF